MTQGTSRPGTRVPGSDRIAGRQQPTRDVVARPAASASIPELAARAGFLLTRDHCAAASLKPHAFAHRLAIALCASSMRRIEPLRERVVIRLRHTAARHFPSALQLAKKTCSYRGFTVLSS